METSYTLFPIVEPGIQGLVTLLLSLGGVASLNTMLVNLGKLLEFVKDGKAQDWQRGLNTLALVGLFVIGTWFPNVDIFRIDEFAAQIANLGIALIGVLPMMFKISGGVHDTVRGLKIVGKSRSEL